MSKCKLNNFIWYQNVENATYQMQEVPSEPTVCLFHVLLFKKNNWEPSIITPIDMAMGAYLDVKK